MIRTALIVLCLGSLAVACSPGVGDACSTNSDCGSDRVCDKSQPDGYCTRTPCVRTGCPGDSVCVVYADQVSYCMQRCGPFNFCREQYTCLEGYPKYQAPGETYPAFCSPGTPAADAPLPDAGTDAPGADPAGG